MDMDMPKLLKTILGEGGCWKGEGGVGKGQKRVWRQDARRK